MASPDTASLVAHILNDAWLVRHYARGGRSLIQGPQRTEAIEHLGITCRDAFNRSEDFEALLAAIVDGLRPKNDPPF